MPPKKGELVWDRCLNAGLEINRDKVVRRTTPAQIGDAQRLSQQCQAQQFKGYWGALTRLLSPFI